MFSLISFDQWSLHFAGREGTQNIRTIEFVFPKYQPFHCQLFERSKPLHKDTILSSLPNSFHLCTQTIKNALSLSIATPSSIIHEHCATHGQCAESTWLRSVQHQHPEYLERSFLVQESTPFQGKSNLCSSLFTSPSTQQFQKNCTTQVNQHACHGQIIHRLFFATIPSS